MRRLLHNQLSSKISMKQQYLYFATVELNFEQSLNQLEHHGTKGCVFRQPAGRYCSSPLSVRGQTDTRALPQNTQTLHRMGNQLASTEHFQFSSQITQSLCL